MVVCVADRKEEVLVAVHVSPLLAVCVVTGQEAASLPAPHLGCTPMALSEPYPGLCNGPR